MQAFPCIIIWMTSQPFNFSILPIIFAQQFLLHSLLVFNQHFSIVKKLSSNSPPMFPYCLILLADLLCLLLTIFFCLWKRIHFLYSLKAVWIASLFLAQCILALCSHDSLLFTKHSFLVYYQYSLFDMPSCLAVHFPQQSFQLFFCN